MNRTATASEIAIVAAGTARADLTTIAGMRKRLPAWAPPDTAAHFLKHADEQTVVAVAAVDRAIAELDLELDIVRQWAILAAPRYVGRLAGASVLDRFARGGGPSVSPHVIPQSSLHSVSGALSVLLACQAPNLGVGGSCESLAEGLLAAVSLAGLCETTGAWLIGTAWEPEPTLEIDGRSTNQPVCHAFALALQAHRASGRWGKICLGKGAASAAGDVPAELTPNVPQIVQALEARSGQSWREFLWPLPGGARVTLEIRATPVRLANAA